MTELLDRAVARARRLPAPTQDALARVMLTFAGEDQPTVELSPEEAASLATSLDQARRGEFARAEDVEAVWAKHGL